jgi:predicted RNase H-like HicB family nuclease
MTDEHRYEIDIFWSDADQAYVAEVPELPGCAADGASYADALVAAQEAIEVWITAARELGRSIPVPRQRQTQL